MNNHQDGYLLIITLLFMTMISLLLYTMLENNLIAKKIVENYQQRALLDSYADSLLVSLEKNNLRDKCSTSAPCEVVGREYFYRYFIENIFHDDCVVVDTDGVTSSIDYLQLTLILSSVKDKSIVRRVQSIVAVPSETRGICVKIVKNGRVGRLGWYAK